MKAAANTLLTNENARILKHTIYEPSLLIFQEGYWVATFGENSRVNLSIPKTFQTCVQ